MLAGLETGRLTPAGLSGTADRNCPAESEGQVGLGETRLTQLGHPGTAAGGPAEAGAGRVWERGSHPRRFPARRARVSAESRGRPGSETGAADIRWAIRARRARDTGGRLGLIESG